jgi:hypothetical protein
MCSRAKLLTGHYLLPPRPFWSLGLRSGVSVFFGGLGCCCPPAFLGLRFKLPRVFGLGHPALSRCRSPNCLSAALDLLRLLLVYVNEVGTRLCLSLQ